MGASRIQILQYLTAIALLGLVAGHLLERIPGVLAGSYEASLKASVVYSVLKSPWRIGLLAMAYAALIHGLNGLRGMLYEWLPGRRRERVWDALFITLLIIFAFIATYAIVKVPPLG